MKKSLILLAGLVIIFTAEILYLHYRLESVLDDIEHQQTELQAEFRQMDLDSYRIIKKQIRLKQRNQRHKTLPVLANRSDEPLPLLASGY
ncbi:MAG TPA: hypothetical protein ENK44_04055 [Caldithrix abyssi]|uniref:Cell division protein FtsL n=1 Tax=Caldithrix abyssi TaxID=187145 RepID=A0A7V4TYP4_CALAY|nr:hypothetical protein [Caldithrix abyssi]